MSNDGFLAAGDGQMSNFYKFSLQPPKHCAVPTGGRQYAGQFWGTIQEMDMLENVLHKKASQGPDGNLCNVGGNGFIGEGELDEFPSSSQ